MARSYGLGGLGKQVQARVWDLGSRVYSTTSRASKAYGSLGSRESARDDDETVRRSERTRL